MSALFKILGLVATLDLVACNQGPPAAQTPPETTPAPMPVEPAPAADGTAAAAPQLQAAMRDLWHGHIVHTRDYAIAVHARKDTDAQAAADSVVANAKQISSAIAGFYGQEAGDRMMALLGGHWGGVKALTDARAKADGGAAERR